MFRPLGFFCALLAVFALAGGHWTALQTVAKARMLYAYTQRSGSVAVAVAETFDGQHPCDLCRKIAAEKSREHKEKSGLPGLKQDAEAKAVLADRNLRPVERIATRILLVQEHSLPGSVRADQPPTPPPRGVISAA